jgi:hypothetical protein
VLFVQKTGRFVPQNIFGQGHGSHLADAWTKPIAPRPLLLNNG